MEHQVRLTKKELRSLDTFQARLVGLLDWLLKNLRFVGYALIPVVVIILGVSGWQFFQGSRANSRLAELGTIEVLFETERVAADKQREALRKQIEDLEKSAKPAAPQAAATKSPEAKGELDAAAKAKKADLEKKIAAVKTDHGGSVEGFKKFFESHAKHAEGWNAGLRAAAIYVEKEKPDEALAIVEKIAINAATAADTFYETQSRLFLSGLYEEKGDFDKALGQISDLEPKANDDLKPTLLLAKGRLLYFKNAKDEANTAFATLIEKYASSSEAQKARTMKGLFNY